MFHLKPKPLPEADTERMSLLLWKWKRQWEAKFEAMEQVSNGQPFNVNGDHVLGDLWDWETFAQENYQDELPSYSAMVCIITPLVLLFLSARGAA
jgi:hypothetical protein